MVCPDMDLTTSLGLCDSPPGIFSTKPITPIALTFAFLPAKDLINPTTAAEPAISYFISSIPCDGLIEIPPLSKVTPFPTKATGFLSFLVEPSHCITTSFGSCTLPCPTPNRAPMPSFSISLLPRTSTLTPNFLSSLHFSE